MARPRLGAPPVRPQLLPSLTNLGVLEPGGCSPAAWLTAESHGRPHPRRYPQAAAGVPVGYPPQPPPGYPAKPSAPVYGKQSSFHSPRFD